MLRHDCVCRTAIRGSSLKSCSDSVKALVREKHAVHPAIPGNSVVESFTRTLKKTLGALVDGDGKERERQLQAVASAHNPTSRTATGFSPFFLAHERDVLPVQRCLDEPRLDPLSVG